MMSDYRAISDTACEAVPSAPPQLRTLTLDICDMQKETFEVLKVLLSMLYGDEQPTPDDKPKDNLLSRVMSIAQNQKMILTALKAIAERL